MEAQAYSKDIQTGQFGTKRPSWDVNLDKVMQQNALTKKAPRARDRPAIWVMTEVPSTTSRVVAAKISEFSIAAMRLYSGRSSVLPPAMMVTMATTALKAATPRALLILPIPKAPVSDGARRGMSISKTTTARSCNKMSMSM